MPAKTSIETDIMKIELHGYYENVASRIDLLKSEDIIKRILTNDYTIWSNKPEEISDRLGWLDSPEKSMSEVHSLNNFATEIINNGFTHALLMGMGGSSLAPEVFSKSFGTKKGYLQLFVLDSTHPEAVLRFEKELDPGKTLYIVSTKSGGTIETISFMKYFFTAAAKKLGTSAAAKHFIAITDPGSGLEETAKQLNFRKIFLNDPNIGGRYSALSLFGIVPAVLTGVDLRKLLNTALNGVNNFSDDKNVYLNNAAVLGSAVGELALHGRDKLTFILSKEVESFGSWIEQLIAESMGKSGKGILPVECETVLAPSDYANDRVFVQIKLSERTSSEKKDNSKERGLKLLEENGNPVIKIELNNIYDLGEQFFMWEAATAIMGWVIGVHPFNQPNVEAAKVSARQMMKQYEENGELPQLKLSTKEKGIEVFADKEYPSLKHAVNDFFKKFNEGGNAGSPRSYIAIHAYLNQTEELNTALQNLRTKLQKKFKSAVTVGYGPRFLHSTGQLHKGDAGKGLFIQFTDSINRDAAVPEKTGYDKTSFTFGILISAQSLGDRQALLDNERNVLKINFNGDIIAGLNKLTSSIG